MSKAQCSGRQKIFRILTELILALVVCCCLPVPAHAEAADNSRILFISSYSYSWPSVPEQLNGITDTLGTTASMQYLFMDTKTVSAEVAEEQLCDELDDLKTTRYDLILLGDDAALGFAMKYQDVYFRGTPMVFFGINSEKDAAAAAKDPLVTGIVESFPIVDTIKAAISLYPNADKVVAITDDTLSGQGSEDQFLDAMDQFPTLSAKILNSSSMTAEKLHKQIAACDENTILIFLMLTDDGDGNLYTEQQGVQFVTDAAKIPVFKADELGIGDGIFGGVVVSYYDMAADACAMASRILQGETPDTIPMQNAKVVSKFDRQVADQYEIGVNKLPTDAILINSSTPFWMQHPYLIACVCLLIVTLMVILLIVLLDNRKRRTLMDELRMKDQHLQTLMDSLPDGIGVFEENADGGVCVTYLNDGFYRMIGGQRSSHWETARKDLMRFVHPDDQAGIASELDRARRTDDRFCDTFRLKDGSGKYLWVTLRANAIRKDGEYTTFYGSFTNVNTIKLIQEQLQESKSSLQTAMNHAGMAYLEYFPDRHVAIEDPHSQMEFGVPNLLENYPDSWFAMKLTHPDDEQTFREIFQRIDRGEQEVSCEIRCRNVAGEYRWSRIRFTSIYDRSGKRLKLIGTSVDITEQKLAAAEYERQMEQVKAAIPDPVVSFRVNLTQNNYHDTETTYEDLKKTEAHTADSLFEAMYSRAVTDSERDEFASVFNRNHLLDTFDRGEKTITFERRAWFDGRIHWITVRTYMARNPVTGDIEALIYSFGIDEQKNMEQIVSSIIKNDYMALLQINLHDNTLRAFSTPASSFIQRGEQPNAETLLEEKLRYGYDGDDVEEFIRCNRFSEIRRHLEEDGEYILYASYRGQSGRIHRTKSVYVWLDQIEQRVCYTLSDITDAFEEEQRRNEKMRKALEDAEQASRTKTEFLSRMSHEIRTPMNAILGLTNLGLHDCTDPVSREYLSKISASGDYLLGLINDVLDMSRIESGKILLNPTNVDTTEFFRSIRTIIEPRMQEKNINFHLETGGIIARYVVIDKMRMQQVYINLLNNAVKFSAPGTTISCVVNHVVCEDDPNAIVSTIVIRDQGCGMSKGFLQRMFLPFEQEHNRYSDAQPGTGLGLAIVKNLIDQAGGTISVKSELDVGTEFTIVLKVRCGQKPEVQSAPQEIPTVSLKGRRVLLVEDHPTNTEIARRLLEREDMVVEHAANGQEAVNLFRAAPKNYYDAILMDIRMPVMDGIQATRLIRKMPGREDAAAVPIIAMTANAFETDRQQTKAAGMNAHLSKPVFPQELYGTLRCLIRTK
ncbi:MAG: response regulator [Oscillibacter sp.]|nr:response regulator [Oscillibacter sp.]